MRVDELHAGSPEQTEGGIAEHGIDGGTSSQTHQAGILPKVLALGAIGPVLDAPMTTLERYPSLGRRTSAR